MNGAEKLFDAITNVREELIEDAQCCHFKKKTIHWQRYAGMAACLALVVVVGFGAMRFIGGFGGTASNSAADMDTGSSAENTTSDSAEAPGDDCGFDAATSPDSDCSSPETDTGTGDTGGSVAATIFSATVLEIHDGYILVEPVESSWELQSADRIHVSLAEIAPPQMEVGDSVTITYSGEIMESDPAQIRAVAIWVDD